MRIPPRRKLLSTAHLLLPHGEWPCSLFVANEHGLFTYSGLLHYRPPRTLQKGIRRERPFAGNCPLFKLLRFGNARICAVRLIGVTHLVEPPRLSSPRAVAPKWLY